MVVSVVAISLAAIHPGCGDVFGRRHGRSMQGSVGLECVSV